MRASKKLRNDELLIIGFAPTLLRMELDHVPLWRGDSITSRSSSSSRTSPGTCTCLGFGALTWWCAPSRRASAD